MTESIQPALTLRGALKLPADKSISHRSALFAAISEETSTITNYSDAADPHSTLDCLEAPGVEIERDGNKITIQGVGRDGFKTPGQAPGLRELRNNHAPACRDGCRSGDNLHTNRR